MENLGDVIYGWSLINKKNQSNEKVTGQNNSKITDFEKKTAKGKGVKVIKVSSTIVNMKQNPKREKSSF